MMAFPYEFFLEKGIITNNVDLIKLKLGRIVFLETTVNINVVKMIVSSTQVPVQYGTVWYRTSPYVVKWLSTVIFS